MKVIGLIGGTSWSSTLEYYRVLNEGVAARRGGLHSARLVLFSLDFAELEEAMHTGAWSQATDILTDAARRVEKAGADFALLCSNLIHRMIADVQSRTRLPLLHIGDAIAAEIRQKGYRTVGLLGTRPTMEEDFYAGRIRQQSGALILTPPAAAREALDQAIFQRLCRNVYTQEDRNSLAAMVEDLKAQGAEAVILGCTELPVLLQDAALPLLNSFDLHARAALDRALG